jgi:hypothetical protein
MGRAPSTFKKSDITRAVKAIAAAGLSVVGVKISPQGEIEVVTGDRPKQDSSALDNWMAKHARSTEGN